VQPSVVSAGATHGDSRFYQCQPPLAIVTVTDSLQVAAGSAQPALTYSIFIPAEPSGLRLPMSSSHSVTPSHAPGLFGVSFTHAGRHALQGRPGRVPSRHIQVQVTYALGRAVAGPHSLVGIGQQSVTPARPPASTFRRKFSFSRHWVQIRCHRTL
jgi:hypothetical protein